MLADISNVDAIYIVCGRTDMRKSIDGLCAIIQEQFSMEIDHSLYLFCGRKCDRIKAILKEPDGIVMIYKRLTAQGSYRWPRDKSEVRNLTWREFDWLMSGIDIEHQKLLNHLNCTAKIHIKALDFLENSAFFKPLIDPFS